MFAEAAGWARPIRFAKGTGGHAPALEVAEEAAGTVCGGWCSPTSAAIAALDAGHVPPFGEIGTEGGVYTAGAQGGAADGPAWRPVGGRDNAGVGAGLRCRRI